MSEEKLIYIEWIDSRGSRAEWTHLEDMDNECCLLNSVGWVLKDTDELIHIVPHMGDDPKQGCGDMVIPKCSIRTLRVLTPTSLDRLEVMKVDLELLTKAIHEGDSTDDILARIKFISEQVTAEINHA